MLLPRLERKRGRPGYKPIFIREPTVINFARGASRGRPSVAVKQSEARGRSLICLQGEVLNSKKKK